MTSIDYQPLALIKPTTDAVGMPIWFPVKVTETKYTLMATGLTGVETVDIYFSPDNGVTQELAYQEDGQVQLTATYNLRSVVSPLLVGVTKVATASPVGVYVQAFLVPGRQ